jgi:hypothetical protein
MGVTVPLFEDGVPERITAREFVRYHLQQFPKITREENKPVLESAISTVYTMFSGVGTIWNNHKHETWFEKTQECYRHLVAWYIADMYPRLVVGVPTMGGIPLKSKKVGDVTITFADAAVSQASGNYRDELSGLKSNPFGKIAYMMITTSIAVKRVRGPR